MTLSEVYFYTVIIIILSLNMVVIPFTEDIKDYERYKKYLKVAFFIGCIGVIVELIEWNYLCRYTCLLITFSPFITLITTKLVMFIFKNVFKREAFQMYKGRLSDGIYKKNYGDLKYKNYYSIYTVCLFFFPVFILITFFIIIEKFC